MGYAPYPPSPYGTPPQRGGSDMRTVIGGILALLGLAIVGVFFAVDWISIDDDDVLDAMNDAVDDADALIGELADISGVSESEARSSMKDAMELTADAGIDFGSSDCTAATGYDIAFATECDDGAFVLTIEEDTFTNEDASQEGGFGNVGTPERLLLLYPLAGLGILGLAVAYAAGAMNQRTALGSILGLAIVAAVVPFLWQTVRTSTWKSELDDTGYADELIGDAISDQDAIDDFNNIIVAPLADAIDITIPTIVGIATVVVAGGGMVLGRSSGGPTYPPQYGAPYGPSAGYQAPPPGWGQQPPPPQGGWGQHPPNQQPPQQGGGWGPPPPRQ